MRRRRTLICGGTCGNDLVSWYLHEFALRLKAERGMRACCLVVLLPHHPAGGKWLCVARTAQRCCSPRHERVVQRSYFF
jgi:hypothetical protein